MTDLCKCDIKEKLKAMWERLQTTIYGIRLNGQRLIPDGQGVIDIMTDDLIEIDDQVRNNALPVENRAIKDYVDTGDSANAADIDSLETRMDSLETITGDAITSADFVANASSVVSVHKHLDTTVDSDSIPVASIVQAGVINASDYAAFLQVQADIEDLKDITITYQVTLPSDTPTQAEISTAFSAAYPTVPLIAGLKVADYNHNLAYQYDGSLWVSQQFTGTIPVATSTVVGGVKSSSTNGEIAVNIGGTMALNGYDSITDRLDDIDGTGGSIDQLESEVGALQSSVEGLDGRLDTAEDNIQMMDSDIEDLSQDITTIDGQIDAINTAVSGIQTSIGSLQTTVAGKQDELTAGENITITNNVISATGGGGKQLYTGPITDLVYIENGNLITEEFDIEISYTRKFTSTYIQYQEYNTVLNVKAGIHALNATYTKILYLAIGRHYIPNSFRDCYINADGFGPQNQGTITVTSGNDTCSQATSTTHALEDELTYRLYV